MVIEVNSNQMETVAGITVEYPYILHRVSMKKTHVPWHWHEEVEFILVNQGGLVVTTMDQTYLLRAGEALFINTNVVCTMQEADEAEDTVISSHLLHPVFLSGHYKSVFETKYLHPILQNKRLDVLEIRGDTDCQRQMLHKLSQAAQLQKEPDSEFQTRNLFSEIWLLLIAEAAERDDRHAPVKQVGQARMQAMLAYIHQNYAERIALENIAASAAVSKRECTRCFQQSIRRAPIEYLMEYRVDQAARLLSDTQDAITDIALKTGFSNSAYFCKVFKAQKGVSPMAFRRGMQV